MTENGTHRGKSKPLVIGGTPTRDVVSQRPRSLLTRLPTPEDEKDSIIQFYAEISANQAAADLDKLEASGLDPSVPWLPPRQLDTTRKRGPNQHKNQLFSAGFSIFGKTTSK